MGRIYLDYNASTPQVGMGAIRLSLGRATTETEVRTVAEQFVEALGSVAVGVR
jgi:cysteine sulfinate desulfinase/cysteine desulfurase-like protein